jgi:uncharacterized integral membrane protein
MEEPRPEQVTAPREDRDASAVVAPPVAASAGAGAEASDEARPASDDARIPRTRVSEAHASLLAGAVVLVLLLVFILENTRTVPITFFGATANVPLGVGLALAAVAAALLVGIVGAARIVQLRRRVRRASR